MNGTAPFFSSLCLNSFSDFLVVSHSFFLRANSSLTWMDIELGMAEMMKKKKRSLIRENLLLLLAIHSLPLYDHLFYLKASLQKELAWLLQLFFTLPTIRNLKHYGVYTDIST